MEPRAKITSKSDFVDPPGGGPGGLHGHSVFWRARARGLVGLLGGSSAGLGVVFGDLGAVLGGS